MANTITSTNMSLVLPVPGIDPGPDWANNLNASLLLVDAHDHSPGKGVPVTPAGMNISSDLTFGVNNATNLRSARFSSQGAVLAGVNDLDCLYVTGVDLYYNDGNGNNVRITQSGGVAGSPGSISNLNSPASAAYVAASSTFVWQSAANTPANLDCASLLIRNLSANSHACTLNPPAAMAANFSLTLPTVPGATNFLSIDSSGNIAAYAAVSAGLTTTNYANASVTRPKLVAVGQQVSSSSASFSTNATSATDVTNLTVTLTTTGRPVIVQVAPAGSSLATFILSKVTQTTTRVNVTFVRGVTVIANYRFGFADGVTSIEFPASLSFVDVVTAGTYVYKVQVQIISSDGIIGVTNCTLSAYEL